MQGSAYTISTAQDAGLMKIIGETLDFLKGKSIVENYLVTSDRQGSNRRVNFEFLYDGKLLQTHFPVLSSSEGFSKKEVISGNIFILTLDLADTDVISFVEGLKEKKIKGYKVEKRAFEILMQEKRENFRIEDVLYTTPYEDRALKVDIIVKVNFYTFDKINQKITLNIPIQLKSSSRGQQLHKEEYPDIPSIVFYENITPENFLRLVTKIIEQYKIFFHKKSIDPSAKSERFHL